MNLFSSLQFLQYTNITFFLIVKTMHKYDTILGQLRRHDSSLKSILINNIWEEIYLNFILYGILLRGPICQNPFT